MERLVVYSESAELAGLIEKLRERLGGAHPPEKCFSGELEEVLAQLVTRNQRLRVLHRLARSRRADERVELMRSTLEQLDARLLQHLSALLARLPPAP
jgi:hypothetical protein